MHNEEINYTEHHYRGMIEGVKEREREGLTNKALSHTTATHLPHACFVVLLFSLFGTFFVITTFTILTFHYFWYKVF